MAAVMRVLKVLFIGVAIAVSLQHIGLGGVLANQSIAEARSSVRGHTNVLVVWIEQWKIERLTKVDGHMTFKPTYANYPTILAEGSDVNHIRARTPFGVRPAGKLHQPLKPSCKSVL